MSKVFLPPIDSQWRLSADWAMRPALAMASDNLTTMFGFNKYPFKDWEDATNSTTNTGDSSWVEPYHKWLDEECDRRGGSTLPKGTVFSVERYHVSRSGEDQITLMLKASPEPRFEPKKRGGKLKGHGRFYVYLADFNSMPELEEVHERL